MIVTAAPGASGRSKSAKRESILDLTTSESADAFRTGNSAAASEISAIPPTIPGKTPRRRLSTTLTRGRFLSVLIRVYPWLRLRTANQTPRLRCGYENDRIEHDQSQCRKFHRPSSADYPR